MNDDLSRLLADIDAVRMNRRRFMGTAAAAGLAATMGGTLATTARAQEPNKGGTFRIP
jgi:peptide/nickel transport system substrate-binding protein